MLTQIKIGLEVRNLHSDRHYLKNIFSHVKRFTAFTLAEVLIVVGILGIVAEMTIPTLVQSVNSSIYTTGALKANSILAQAISLYENDHDCVGDLRMCSDFTYASVDETTGLTIWNVLKPYFRLTQDCGVSPGCFSSTPYKYLNPKLGTFDYNNGPRTGRGILADGSVIGFVPYNCVNDQSCGSFFVDVNGTKGPNQIGRDFFRWDLYSNKLIPYGDGSLTYCDPNGTANGRAVHGTGAGLDCTAAVVLSGKMNY